MKNFQNQSDFTNQKIISKEIVDFFIKNKIYIILPLSLFSALCFVTLISIIETLNENLITKICFSQACLGAAYAIFGKTIEMHLKGIEYIYYLTTIISVSAAVYSYIVSSQSSINTQKINNIQLFKQIIISSLKNSKIIKIEDINITKFYYFIYPNTDDGDFSPSQEYLKKIKALKNSIEKFNRDSSSRNFPEHAKTVIEIAKILGIKFSNRGRRLFIDDENSLTNFLNELNSIILIDDFLKIPNRKYS